MCGRYHMGDEDKLAELREIIDAMNRGYFEGTVKTDGEVFPTDVVPVIALDRNRRQGVFPMAWGYSMPDGRRIINARSETAKARPMFSDGILNRRCVVPASHYFEWTHGGKVREKYAIRPRAGGATYMAGIYRFERNRPVFAILTRPPAEEIAFIHNRMPVLLPRELIGDWVDPRRDAEAVLTRATDGVRFDRAEPACAQTRMDL